MKVRLVASILITMAFFGCTSITHKIESRAYKESPGTFIHPKGWIAIKIKSPSRTENLLRQKAFRSPEAPSITIDMFDTFDRRFPQTQAGCAESYLDGIHDASDESAQKEAATVVENPAHSKLQVYRFHSEWFGDHLVAFLLTESGHAKMELWTKTSQERKEHTATFYRFIQSVRLK